MIDSDENDGSPSSATVVSFPYSRVNPVQSVEPEGAIIYGAFASLIGIPHEQTTGHWCSHCRMIWFGYLLEVSCPTCGNRHG